MVVVVVVVMVVAMVEVVVVVVILGRSVSWLVGGWARGLVGSW